MQTWLDTHKYFMDRDVLNYLGYPEPIPHRQVMKSHFMFTHTDK